MLQINPEVLSAIKENRPVVALESTIISHGMPYPKNVQTALEVERVIREHGANAASFVTGSFSSPTIVHSLDDIVLSTTNLPTPGLTMTFSRIENSCPRPLNFSCMSVFRPDSIVFGLNTAPTTGSSNQQESLSPCAKASG